MAKVQQGLPMLGDWPQLGAYEAWQAKPVSARQVTEDGTLGLRPIKAGEWIVSLGVFVVPNYTDDDSYRREPFFLVLSDLEFRRHFQPRLDMEVVTA